ncbi:MAG TPA: SRPBCC domain-containing protein [Ktedonobacteraceae bacterium]|nr:SRPBCC domain-containing protein [Ktedonobacteraceae bacterium]
MEAILRIEKLYSTSPHRIWQALTDRRQLAQWLMENDFEPRVGHRFTFHMPSVLGFDGIIHGEVLEVEEPYHLSYSWQGNLMPHPTIVTWRLEQVPEGTLLKLEHRGFEGMRGLFFRWMHQNGWARMLQIGLPKVFHHFAENAIAEKERA